MTLYIPAAARGAAAHPRNTGVGILDAAVELVDRVGQCRDVRRGDGGVLQPDRAQLALDGRVGGRADQERVDVVVARDPSVAEPLDLVQRDLRDAVAGHVEDRRVVGEVDERRRGDRGQRVVGRQQRERPRPVRIVVVVTMLGASGGGGTT
jgi:hypothetical protein